MAKGNRYALLHSPFGNGMLLSGVGIGIVPKSGIDEVDGAQAATGLLGANPNGLAHPLVAPIHLAHLERGLLQ
jgi:hypothetical protein